MEHFWCEVKIATTIIVLLDLCRNTMLRELKRTTQGHVTRQNQIMGLESHILGLPSSTPYILPRVSAILEEVNFCPAEIYWNSGGITRYINNECYQII